LRHNPIDVRPIRRFLHFPALHSLTLSEVVFSIALRTENLRGSCRNLLESREEGDLMNYVEGYFTLSLPARRVLSASFLALLLALSFGGRAHATTLFGLTDELTGGRRWDAAPRSFNFLGGPAERSLDGGLRWNVQGGSLEAFRDMFAWQGSVPSVGVFEQTIHDSFAAWTAVDPAIGLPAPFHFVHDPMSPVADDEPGAEIDLFARPTGQGVGITGANTFANFTGGGVTLTSGTTNYLGQVMTGTDIWLNNESSGTSQTQWTLSLFRKVLTHEIGHALGLGDVDIDNHRFLDDNFDATSQATAVATLTNEFSHLIDVLNPANSPLTLYTVPTNNLGLEAPGVHILMESAIDVQQIGILTADDFAGRQFLYPAVAGAAIPEPATLWLAGVGVLAAAWKLRRRTA
jgi:hypothetical protein